MPMQPGTERLDVQRIGSGPPVLLVHGSIVGAHRTWRNQLELADRWALCLVNRPGFAGSPPLPRGDFEAEAELVAALLDDEAGGAHLVGHSYGAVIALFAAALRPGAVRSLTVSEPGCLTVGAGVPHVDAMLEHGNALYDGAGAIEPHQFLLLFRSGVNSAHETPPELDPELMEGARMAMAERRPWDTLPPLDALAAAPFPKLVISGDHSPAFETVCDTIAERIGAAREIVRGGGHTIPRTGEPYNAVLERFLQTAGRPAPR